MKNSYLYPLKPPPLGRGVIKEYSMASRFRLLKQIASISWYELPNGVFVTLTYPDEVCVVDPKTATMQRHLWIRYAEKYLQEKTPMLWRKEYIDRKSGIYTGRMVQHFHLSVFTKKRLPMELVNEWWGKAIGHTGYLRTEVKRMNTGEHAAFYLAKYMAKDESSPSLVNPPYLSRPGRAWGFHRPKLIPRYPVDSIIGFTDEQWAKLIDAVKGDGFLSTWDAKSSFTLLGERAVEAKKRIYEILS